MYMWRARFAHSLLRLLFFRPSVAAFFSLFCHARHVPRTVLVFLCCYIDRLILNEGLHPNATPTVVLGISGKPEKMCNLDLIQRDKVGAGFIGPQPSLMRILRIVIVSFSAYDKICSTVEATSTLPKSAERADEA